MHAKHEFPFAAGGFRVIVKCSNGRCKVGTRTFSRLTKYSWGYSIPAIIFGSNPKEVGSTPTAPA
jgi:hypothetical protein